MISFENAVLKFDQDRCCQCGVCLSSCTRNALTPKWTDAGFYSIEIDEAHCVDCGLCARVCPSINLPSRAITEGDWTECESVWLGWSLDAKRRRESSSGGVARTLIEEALNTEMCDAAWCVVKTRGGGPAHGALLRKGDDLSSISNSVYEPVLAMAAMPHLKPSTRLLVVGTNCQLQGVEILIGRHIRLTKIAILCKQQKTARGADYIRKRLRADSRADLQFRGNGWPGECSADGKVMQWEHAAALLFGKSLWRLPACRTCAQPLGYDADITLADPWNIRSAQSVGDGKTLMIIRSANGARFLDRARRSLGLEPSSISEAKVSVNWPGMKAKMNRIPYYLRTERSLVNQFIFKLGDCQRALYEWLLLKTSLPTWAYRILNRIPFLG